MSISILARSELLRVHLADETAADLRITGFQSPAEDERDDGLSLDRLTDLFAPHMWPVRVLDMSLVRFGLYRGDLLVVNRSATRVDNRLVVADLGGECYQVRMVVKDLFGGRWLRAADCHIQDVQLDGDVPIEIWGMVKWVLSDVAP